MAGAATLFSIEPHADGQQRNLVGRQFLRIVTGDAGGFGHLRRQQRVVPEHVFGLSLVEAHGCALPVVAYRAAEAIHGMLVEDMTGMSTMRLWDIGHARIVDAVVAGDATIHRAKCRYACLLHLHAKPGEQFSATIVGGFLAKYVAVFLLHGQPLRQIVLAYRRIHQIDDGDDARHQQEPAINPGWVFHRILLSGPAIARATSKSAS